MWWKCSIRVLNPSSFLLEGAMTKYRPYDYSQRAMIPVSLEDQLMAGTSEFAIHTLVEDRMDLSVFEDRYNNDETGRWAYDPRVLLKVVLFAYSRGLISSRKMERACRENITFMALTCGQCPDHSTIAAFVSSMRDEILPIFSFFRFRSDIFPLHSFEALDDTLPPPKANRVPPNK